MIDQTIPFAQLTQGMARCVREWILPHLSDPMARVQAEQLAAMLETLPRSIGPAAAANIRADNGETRALLQQLGVSVAPSAADDLDALVRENSGLKARARELAAELRGRADEESKRRLVELQRHLLRSLKRELGGKGADETDFATLTAKDSAARRKE
jgi:hypothetical protein